MDYDEVETSDKITSFRHFCLFYS